MRRWILLLALLAAPVAASETAPAETGPRPVVSEVVALRTAFAVSYVGTVAAKVEVDLGFPMAGTVAERPVDRGDVVAGGDILARLDPQDLDASVRAAEASVAVAEAQADTARDARDRARELAARGVGAQTRLDDSERALVAATARLEQARAALARARDTRALATLAAPRDGIVTEVFAEPGAALSAGQPVLQLSGIGDRELVIDLSEADAAAPVPGTEFVARLVANPAVEARARLDRIDPVAERNTRTWRAHLRLDAPPEAFRLGSLAHVVPARASEGVIVLPRAAVLDGADGPSVWVVSRDAAGVGKVHRTVVETGAGIRDLVVIASGLAPGDEVVTRGIHSLTEGQAVGERVAR